MITITLRKCTSENNRLTKSFEGDEEHPVDKVYEGVLREAADVLSPKIKIETTDNLSGYNYVEIPTFGRKYFARVQCLQEGLWEIDCEVDVLSTYATGIKSCMAIVKRTAGKGKINYYMNDGALYTEQRQVVTYHTFKKSRDYAKLGTESYYLLVAGGSYQT